MTEEIPIADLARHLFEREAHIALRGDERRDLAFVRIAFVNAPTAIVMMIVNNPTVMSISMRVNPFFMLWMTVVKMILKGDGV